MKALCTLTACLLLFCSVNASHIVGGELSYTCSGNNQYHITLKLYRDCFCTNCAPFGNPEYLAIFNANGTLVAQPSMPFPGSTHINPTVTSSCLIPPAVCVEQAIYTADVTLTPSAGGYTIVYQRCCRNNGVVNMITGQGATYTIEIPDPGLATCNSSPHFNNLPPLFICANAPLNIDYSATDPDNDSLVYSLCDPFDGATQACPDPSPAATGTGCATSPTPPPYSSALYNSPYSASNFTNNPSNSGDFTIDPRTGILSGTPNTVGLFDVTVCVSEYRNGNLLGVLRRDFQFTVTQCNTPIATIPRIGTMNGTGVYVRNCMDLTVNFVNNSYNPPPNNQPIYYYWNFGVVGSTTDTSTLINPSFTYPDTGVYLVQLIAKKDEGNGNFCSDTTYSYVVVFPNFNADFTANNVCQDSLTQFTDQTTTTNGFIDHWNWDFGDGLTSTLQNPTHRYLNAGTYTVTLIDGSNLGCLDTARKQVTVYPRHNANFTFNSPCLGSATVFADTASGVSTYNWNFGDGATTSGTGNPSHTYTTAGTDTVTLIVQSTHGCRDTVKHPVTILPKPNAGFTFTSACTGSPVTFTDTAGNFTSYTWNFGDGSAASNLVSPTHTYSVTGTYTVTLAVQNASGCKDTVSRTVTTLPSPVVTTSNDTTICKYGSAQLSATGGVSYQWRPITGLNNPSSQNPIASPLTSTTYTVSVTNSFNCSTSDSVRMNVFALPPANLVLDSPCINTPVRFSDNSTGITSYNWNFGDGSNNSNQATPTHVYQQAGTYTITLIAQTSLGCLDTLLQSIQVYSLPDATFNFTVPCVNSAAAFTGPTSGISSYLWSFGDGSAGSTQANPSHTYAAPGNYLVTLTVQSAHGCTDSSSQTLSPLPLPEVTVSNDTIVCPGTDLQLFANGGNTYLWQPAMGLSDSTIADPVASVTSAITYTVYVTNQSNCTASATIQIGLLPLIAVDAGPDVEIDKGQSIQLSATTAGTNIVWSPSISLNNPNTLTPTASPDTTTSYIITVTGPNGCLASDTVIVKILQDAYAFPDAFTPNGDGKNDNFYPVLQPDVTVVTFRIYNRWGQLVYDNPTQPWDGKFKGAEQPTGTYIYYVVLRIFNSLLADGHRDIKHDGSVNLLR